jgi:predicted HD phosphohydrolase
VTQDTATVTLADIVHVLESGAQDFDAGGERAGVSLLDHGLQCAYLLRCRRPDDLELQVAGLVHDIGQTLTGSDEAAHGEAAAHFVRPVLGSRVAALVRLHVPAKRYLVSTRPGYLARLSRASLESLAEQGGPMDADEAAAFASRPYALDAAELRRCDDNAKKLHAVVYPLADWLPALAQVAARACVRATTASPPGARLTATRTVQN